MDTTNVKGIGPAIATQLAELGVHTAADLATADPKTLMQVSGIGPARAIMLIREAQDVIAVLPKEPGSAATPDVVEALTEPAEPASEKAKKKEGDKPKKKSKDKPGKKSKKAKKKSKPEKTKAKKAKPEKAAKKDKKSKAKKKAKKN